MQPKSIQIPMPQQADQYELPAELTAKPLVLVGVSGLDTINNAIHKSIWEMFSSNRRLERSPVLFKLLSNALEFPVVKPKRNSYEWYQPKGILKKNWMNKYLNEIPAVIAVFYDLDWNDAQWNEKMIECASRVQSVRAAIEGRNTSIVVVLIQDVPPLPTGEDVLANERGVAICASCELNSKSLFVLPHGDHLQGYVKRLENAFYDFAQNFYYLEARKVKSHKEFLNKNYHHYLFVRHQFKMGFFSELRQDIHTAHKHYTHAYNNLLEIRIVDTNATEIRTVASFINYKLCRLMFAIGLPRDAISQFRSHIDRFKMRIGFQELAFEHHAWISQQFNMFGSIFDEAVKLGLPAVQTQHPGVYYHQAAQHAIIRKQTCLELCKNITEYPNPDPLENLQQVEFYGQRPWRPGKVNAEPPDPHLESRGIQALQYLENQVNHSGIIIALYGLAISQYKMYKCTRTRRFLVIQMADEYYTSEDYGKALTLYTHMLWDYRNECWWSLITDVLRKALNCAYLTASIQDYILLSLKLLGPSATISKEQKRNVYDSLNRVFKKKVPELQCEISIKDNTVEAWRKILKQDKINLSLDVGNIASCIDSKARFVQEKYQADQLVSVELLIRSTCPFHLKFTKVAVVINTPTYSSEFAVTGHQDDEMMFENNEAKKFLVEFMPDPNDVGQEMQIGSINLYLGNVANGFCADLKFNGLNPETTVASSDLTHFKRSSKSVSDFDNMKPLSTSQIVPRQSQLKVTFEHLQPALLKEYYKIKVVVVNDESHPIENLQIEVVLQDEGQNQTTEFYVNDLAKIEKLPLELQIDTLNASESFSRVIFMKSKTLEPRNLQVKMTYLLKSEKPIASIKEDVLYIPVVKAFEVETSFWSSRLREISKFHVGEPFIIMPTIKCQSPWPIIIENCVLKESPFIELVNRKCQVAGLVLQKSDHATDVYTADATKQSKSPVSVGEYTITWKRENGSSTVSEVTITGLSIGWSPLAIDLPLPEYGLVRTPLLITYEFYNRSQQLIQLEMNMEGSDAFMFAGYRQLQISILPGTTKVFNYNLYPLIAGNVKLPRLTLAIPNGSTEGPALQQEQLNNLIERSLPVYIYIMPQSKGLPKSQVKVSDIKLYTTVA